MEATLCSLLVVLVALVGARASPAGARPQDAVVVDDAPSLEGFRLNTALVPRHYQITIKPYDESFKKFAGVVVIDIEMTWDAREIVLHAGGGLNGFQWPTVEQMDRGPLEVRSHNSDGEVYTIRLDQPALQDGKKYRVTVKYNGTLSTDQRGFFRPAVNDGNKTKFLAMTHFSPIYARRAFPCFDEPSFQANFTLAIAHPENLAARASTPVSAISHTGDANGFLITTFETTPAMSPHSLSWIVTDLKFAGAENDRVHTYGLGAKAAPVATLHASSNALLQLLEEYTKVAGPEKLEQVVVPRLDAGTGASFGVLAFKEEDVLAHRQYKSASRLAGVLAVAGGLARQWCGNVVAPSWWGHAWITEGLATLMQYTLVDKTNPEMQILQKFGAMETMRAMAADYEDDAFPLTLDAVSLESEVLAQVGVLPSAKGASVLKMLQRLITRLTFQKGVQYFLSDMKGNTSTPDDLWAAMARAAEEDDTAPEVSISRFGRSWTQQAGYPVVTAVRNYEGNTVNLTQAPFPRRGDNGTTLDDGIPRAWWIPLQLSSKEEPDLDHDAKLLPPMEPFLEAWGPDSSTEWLLINSDQRGYYRVNYDLFNWLRLVRAFHDDPDDELPSESSRAMLLDDALTLADHDLLEHPVALRLMEAMLVRERQPAPWIVAARHLDRMAKYFRGASSEHESAFDQWVVALVDGLYTELDFPDDEPEVVNELPQRALRALVAEIACKAKHPKCAAAARKQYLLWRNGDSVSGDSLALAVCHGVTGPWARADALTHALSKLDGANEADVIRGLGCLSGQHRVDFLGLLTSGSTLSVEQVRMAWRALAAGQTGLRLALDALSQHREEIVNKFDTTFFVGVLQDLASSATTDAHLAVVRDLASYVTPTLFNDDAEKAAAAVRTAEDNVAWRQLHFYSVFDEMNPVAADSRGLSSLPDNVVPVHYDLRLLAARQAVTDEPAMSTVEMTVTAVEDTDLLSFHTGKGLDIEHLAVTDNQNDVLMFEYPMDGTAIWKTYNEESEIMSVRLNAPMLADNTYTVSIEYDRRFAVLPGDLAGGFFEDFLPDGLATVMGTRMEPMYAHRVFPCFNDPHFLATFRVTLAIAGTDRQALSITQQTSSMPDPALPNMTVVDFKATRALPPHLLPFAVIDDSMASAAAGPLKPVDGLGSATMTNVRVRQEVAKSATAVARQAADLLQVLDGALGPRSPLAHQEILAVPALLGGPIFAPALALLREGDVLVDNVRSLSEQELGAALALANAQAHLFIGIDVTLEERSGLWLRDGLAAYLESWAVDQLHGEKYGAVARAGVDRVHRGLALDAMETAMPLATTEGDAANKGVGVVRMLAGLMGDTALLKGLKTVMQNAPSKVSHVEVLQTLQRAADRPLPVNLVDLAESWASQPGFPVLTATRNYTSGRVDVRQERFSWTAASDNRTWIVPLHVSTVGDTTWLDGVLTGNSTTVDFDGRAEDYMLVNAGLPGFYRVNYDAQNWELLTRAAAAGELSEAQRATLLDDAVALCQAGRLDVLVVLELLKAVTAAADGASPCVPCWLAARSAIVTLGHLTRHDPAHRAMYGRLIAEKLVGPSAIDWTRHDGEAWAHGAARAILTPLACGAEDMDCMEQARVAFREWVAYGDIDANVLEATVCSKVRTDLRPMHVVEMMVRIASTEDASLRRAYIAGLGCVNDEALRKTVMTATAIGSAVDLPDVLPMFEAIMDNSGASLDLVIDYVAANFTEITQKLGQDVANAVLYAAAERAHEDHHYTKLLSLLDAAGSASTPVQAAVRRAAASRDWAAATRSKLVAWVYEQFGETPPAETSTSAPTTSPSTESTTPGARTEPSTEPSTKPTTQPPAPRPPQSSTQAPSSSPKPNSATAASINIVVLLLSATAAFLL